MALPYLRAMFTPAASVLDGFLPLPHGQSPHSSGGRPGLRPGPPLACGKRTARWTGGAALARDLCCSAALLLLLVISASFIVKGTYNPLSVFQLEDAL